MALLLATICPPYVKNVAWCSGDMHALRSTLQQDLEAMQNEALRNNDTPPLRADKYFSGLPEGGSE